MITVSRIRCFLDCPYKHGLKYVDGWRSTEEARPLYIGTAVHVGLEAWWSTGGSIVYALRAIDDAEQQKPEPMDPYDMAMVRALIHEYDARWKNAQEQFEVVAVEQKFQFPIVNPHTGSAGPQPMLAAGKIDAVAKHVDGGLYVIEHKTTSDDISEPTADYWTRLVMDFQLAHYSLGALSFGYELHGVLYDVLRKPQLKVLRESNPETRYKKDGQLKANCRDRDETPGEHEHRLRTKIGSAWDEWLVRKPVFLTDQDIARYALSLWDIADLMMYSSNGPRPKNDQACQRIGRGKCEFFDHCYHGAALEDHPNKWEQIDDVHPELGEKK